MSPARARILAGQGIHTVRDLLTHFPRRYIDLSAKKTIVAATIGSQCTIEGVVNDIALKRPRPHLVLVEIALVDDTGILIVTCFRQPWLMDRIKAGTHLVVAGKVDYNLGFKRMVNPYLEVLDASQVASGIIVAVHPACEKISAAWMRRLVANALRLCRGLYDPLPVALREKYRLMSRASALAAIHFPHTMEEVYAAHRRLVYEEVLLLELLLMSETQARAYGKRATCHVTDGLCVRALEQALPFSLTEEQQKAKEDIFAVMAAPHVANHMLLGDVGTGKTIVAAFALAAAADTHTQAVLMAPTEVLANQHAKRLKPLLADCGVTCDLLTSSTPAAKRSAIDAQMAQGTLDVLIGTHALLEDDVTIKNLSLVIIDEQQRFGVLQRAKLLAKGDAPDALFLTATPIPRTLALTLFGNLTLSYLKCRPHQQTKRETQVYHKSECGRAYDAARGALMRGEQVYVVCPLIGCDTKMRDVKATAGTAGDTGPRRREIDEEAYEYAAVSIEDDRDFNGDNLRAATKEAAYLQAEIFADWQVELLHGRMSSAEKKSVMQRFYNGEVQVLVTTTVIEVGVDVANATVMIIQDADRFGLSQLHQLRGRVGRGKKSAHIYLLSASKSETALARLKAMEGTDDGFELAQFDLSLRREGDILGNRQHGASALKLLNVTRDSAIIEAAHSDALAIIEKDPTLNLPAHRLLAHEMRCTFAGNHVQKGG